MKLYYAVGGGLGHITRTQSFISHFRLENVIVVTSCMFAKSILGNIPFHVLPSGLAGSKESLSNWIKTFITENNISEIYLDAFPAGIIGEWNNTFYSNITFYYVARILNLYAYKKHIGEKLPVFKTVFICEWLPEHQVDFISKLTDELVTVDFNYPEVESVKLPDFLRNKQNEKVWLIIHSGNKEECMVLYQHAFDLAQLEITNASIILIHPEPYLFRGEKIEVHKYFHLTEMYKLADKIFTGCGFNSMYQLKNYRKKHIFIPFHRKFDDQFFRAKYFRCLTSS
ncbi:hypothetical protein [Chondrinema litorale]|uniref:hypothetical protein n=1 Tax=Chondrinema litorale TaxID=2994555 RepID=UPI002543026D|nr:hypothetical protein [Chondrinema litorale]UZR95415.1 hypothetical protein OQ292_06260 [Chondrinema litorale]